MPRWRNASFAVIASMSLASVASARCTSPFGEKVADYGGAAIKKDRPWMTFADTPQDALRRNQQGRVIVSFEITPQGRATNCIVAVSSGYRSLDGAVCPALERRARFEPKVDGGGPVKTSGRLSVDFWQPDPRDC